MNTEENGRNLRVFNKTQNPLTTEGKHKRSQNSSGDWPWVRRGTKEPCRGRECPESSTGWCSQGAGPAAEPFICKVCILLHVIYISMVKKKDKENKNQNKQNKARHRMGETISRHINEPRIYILNTEKFLRIN